MFHSPLHTASLIEQKLPVTIHQTSGWCRWDDLGGRRDTRLPKQAQEAMHRGKRPAPIFSSAQVARQKARDHLLVEITETTITARQPTVQAGDETEMLPDSFGPIALVLKQCEVRLCIRTEWSGLQASDGLEFNE